MEDRGAILQEIKEFRPTHILNCAGVTGKKNVDDCEDNKELTVRANVIGTLNLCDICFLHDIHMTNLSTGCIYHYDDDQPQGVFDPETNNWVNGGRFYEKDEPNFDGSWYSQTKAYVDRILFRSFPNVLTLRLRMPISDDLHPKNFVAKIARYEKLVNIPNSMSVLYDLIPLMLGMMDAKKTGLYNFTNPGVVSHNQVMDFYIKYIDPTKKVTNFTLEEHDKILKAKRSNNELDASKLVAAAKELGLPLPEIRQSLDACFQRMAKNLAPQSNSPSG